MRSNKRRSLRLALIGAVGAVLIGASAPAVATPSSSEEFFLTQHDDFATIAWDAHGAFQDSGTWEKGLVTFSGGRSPVFAGMIQTVETNRDGTGTFRMNFQGLVYNATGAFSGTWNISGGTGAYSGLHGNGTWYEVDIPDPDSPGHLLFTFPCIGHIHMDGS